MSDSTWEPVLDGRDAADAHAVVRDIAAALVQRRPIDAPGFKGAAATALLLGMCDSPDAASWLEEALRSSMSKPMTMALFGGASAMAWMLHEFAEGPEADAMLEHFDTALWRHLDVPQWFERHDLMSGLVGVGTMVSQRSDARSRRIAERVLTHLETTAITSGVGITWRTPPEFLPEVQRAQFPNGMIDLGVAHGVPGVIGMLAQFLEAKIEVVRSRALLSRAVAWLLDAVPRRSPRFGTSWPIDYPHMRIGWCYGDIGVAGVLLLASRALDSDGLELEALDLLRQNVENLHKRDVPDASFCHGAAGLAHVYNVAYQRTKAPDLRSQSVHWLRELLRGRAPQKLDHAKCLMLTARRHQHGTQEQVYG